MKKLIAIILLLFIFALPVRADMNPEFEPVELTVNPPQCEGLLRCHWKLIITALVVLGGGAYLATQIGGDNGENPSGTIIVKKMR